MNDAFPGRLIGGSCLIAGPLVFLAGLVVRHIGFRAASFTPAQQAVREVARGAPRLAFWGGMLFAFAMLARLYFAGVDRTAFQLVERLGLPEATDFVMNSWLGVLKEATIDSLIGGAAGCVVLVPLGIAVLRGW